MMRGLLKKSILSVLVLALLAGLSLPSAAATWYPTHDGKIMTFVGKTQYWLSLDTDTLMEYANTLSEGLGLSQAATAAVLANIEVESCFNPTKVGDDGFAFGICQWRGPRLDALVEFCKEEDLNPITIEGQMAFLIHDLKENYLYAYDLILGVPDDESGTVRAAYHFCAQYEVPADPEEESPAREELAKYLIYPLIVELSEEEE